MTVYGYTVVSIGGCSGRKSNVKLYLSDKIRDIVMYRDYSKTFDTLAEDNGFKTVGHEVVDANGNPKQSEEEFIKRLWDSKDIESESFGLIQAPDFCVLYEPFSRQM